MASENVEIPEINEEDKEVVQDLTNPDVVTKYKLAGDIAQDALKEAVKLSVAGAKVVDICKATNAYILQRTGAVFKGKKVEKGIGFPTCVSLNHVIDHFAPLEGDTTELKNGDVVKIDLGVNIDGFVAIGAHTLVLRADGETVEGPKANVVAAVHYAREAAQRVVKAGNKGKDLSNVLEKVAKEFGVNQIQTIMSHQIERCKLDAKKSILNRPDPNQKSENVEFLPGEAYLIDVVMSTGEGKGREADTKPTIYKREAEAKYLLKRKASRAVHNEIVSKAPHYPFHVSQLEDKAAGFGLVECLQHNLVTAYPVLLEREGQFVAHAKFTLLILPSGQIRLTGLPIDLEGLKPDKKIEDKELLEILAQSAGGAKKKVNKKKNKNKKKAGAAAAADEEE